MAELKNLELIADLTQPSDIEQQTLFMGGLTGKPEEHAYLGTVDNMKIENGKYILVVTPGYVMEYEEDEGTQSTEFASTTAKILNVKKGDEK